MGRIACTITSSSGIAVVLVLGLAAAPADSTPQNSKPEQVTLAIRLEVRGTDASSLAGANGRVVLNPSSKALSPVIVPVAEGSVAAVSIARVPAWTVSTEIPGFWSPNSIFVPAEREDSLTVGLWPTGRLSGGVKVRSRTGDETAGLPDELVLRFRSPVGAKDRERVPDGKVACPVDKGQWACALPAGTLDLRIRAHGFASYFRWGTAIPVARTLRLGTVTLVKGASLIGHVEVPETGISKEGCTATLATAKAAVTPDPRSHSRLQQAILTRTVRQDGFFQFDGVAPGRYVLQVSQPGFATTRVYPVDIVDDGETEIKKPITLTRPLDMDIQVEPPTDWSGTAWKVEVTRASDFSTFFEEVYEGSADAMGHLTLRDQSPGLYRVSVADFSGSSLAWQELALDSDNRTVRLEVPLIWITGTVTLGEEPLAARLWFGGRHGTVSVAMRADSSGEFEGFLPLRGRGRKGTWFADVEADDPPVKTQVKEIKVRPDQDGEATVRVKLPDTEVYGRVVEEGGHPVPGARVWVSSGGVSSWLTTDEQGEFRFRGSPEGATVLTATSRSPKGKLTAEPVFTVLQESAPTGPIELRLLATRSLSGRVLTSTGTPVVGAAIQASAYSPRLGHSASTQSSLDGGFEVLLPQGTKTAQLTVMPPAHSLSSYLVDIEQGPHTLTVESVGGTLEILFHDPEAEAGHDASQPRTFVLLQDRLPLTFQQIYQWAAGNGQRFDEVRTHLILPRLAPGEYTACLASQQALSKAGALGSWESGLTNCASAYLPPGGEARMRLGGE